MKFSWLLVPSLALVFIVFLKIGLLFFGGGYVVIPVMHRELVTNLHWLSEQEFIDGTAISQLTPGPVAIMATFAGYSIAGVLGALVGTFAMFLPGSVLMFFIADKYEKIKDSQKAKKVLNTAIPAIVGLLLSASYQIGKNVLGDWFKFLMFVISAVLLVRYRANPLYLIAFNAALGVILKM